MATKYLRIAPKSGLSCVDNIAASTQNIRKNWVMHNFKIAVGQYANGDKIEIRLPGAKQITGWSITNATTGAIIPNIPTITRLRAVKRVRKCPQKLKLRRKVHEAGVSDSLSRENSQEWSLAIVPQPGRVHVYGYGVMCGRMRAG